jgi:transcriptional regulator with XRE-family HTH domain
MGSKGGRATRTIRELRQERGWTQSKLAMKVGVQPHSVYLWESGRRTPRVAHLRKLGQVFEISWDEILLEPTPTVPQLSSPASADARSRVFSARQMSNTVRGIPQTRLIIKD